MSWKVKNKSRLRADNANSNSVQPKVANLSMKWAGNIDALRREQKNSPLNMRLDWKSFNVAFGFTFLMAIVLVAIFVVLGLLDVIDYEGPMVTAFITFSLKAV